ncbi:MAG: AMP-binding protein [Firmicutes bacterium]|nr:AMP-binding protein [Bacillota bacterium]
MKKLAELNSLYPAKLHDNLRDMIKYAAETYADDTAFIIKHKIKGEDPVYERKSFIDLRNDVNCLGAAFLKRGFKGKRIAVTSKNRYEWMVSYFAALGGIGISVPLDKALPYEEMESSLARSYTDIVVYDNDMKPLMEQIKAAGNTKVTTWINMDEAEDCINVPQLIAEGKALLEAGEKEYLTLPIDSKAVDILLFTSGTTSMAKAVMLSQYNITFNIYSLQRSENIHSGDVNMAFLPYHHTFGSTGQMLMIACGVTTAFCDGLKYLQKNMVEYKVSVFFCVPLLIESIYKKVMATVKKEGKEKTVAFGIKLTKFLLKFGIDIRRKVFKQILDQLGGNLRFVISGASAIDPEALEGFINFGIDAVQGFGMTEAAPVISAETPQQRKSGSIGLAMPDVEVTIDNPDADGIGEIIARGPNIMAGYYENEEETAKVLADGWLHTGDLGYIDEDGYLFICGRKKNVIVLKNGKNVYPEELEMLIANLPYVAENFVFGQPRHNDDDEKDLIVCTKIVYNPEYFKDTHGLDIEGGANEDAVAEIKKHIRRDIDEINKTLPLYKQLFRLIITDEPMIKTTTGKVKRYEEVKNL